MILYGFIRIYIDLHGFTLLEANEKVKELINSCQQKGFKEILLITGKGLHSNVDQNTFASNPQDDSTNGSNLLNAITGDNTLLPMLSRMIVRKSSEQVQQL